MSSKKPDENGPARPPGFEARTAEDRHTVWEQAVYEAGWKSGQEQSDGSRNTTTLVSTARMYSASPPRRATAGWCCRQRHR
jgi:hypothetical protein